MNISSVSSLNYYNTSTSLKGKVSSTTDETTEEEQKIGGGRPPQGPPPPKPPEETNIDSNGDSSWDSDELTSYTEYAKSEYGVELDAESLISDYDSDGDGVLGESEISSLMDDNALQLPPPPPRNNTPEQQMGMMAQMQSTTSLNATTLNIADFLTEEDEEDSVSSISLDAINIEDYLFNEEDEEDSVDSNEEVNEVNIQDLIKQRLQQRAAEAYSNESRVNEQSQYFA